MLHRPKNSLVFNICILQQSWLYQFLFTSYITLLHIHVLDICHWIQLPLANYKPSIFSWESQKVFIPTPQTNFTFLCIIVCALGVITTRQNCCVTTQITKALCDNTNKSYGKNIQKGWPIGLCLRCKSTCTENALYSGFQ